ncbi:MAG TPA: hypothetical protein VLY23_18750 [Candidatus Acidoferrum sp.]|nr:hypothetical protein [Candidatus Acidoferrum sp.]
METLNLSGSTPPPESRLKSLFWPSIQTSSDVDYLGAQGYWVCVIVGLLSLAASAVQQHPIAGSFAFLLYFLGGVGVRERSRFAAAVSLVFFMTDFVASIVIAGAVAVGPASGVFRVLITALLLSNLRATWIASQWKPDADQAAPPPRFGDTWTDKFADRFPMWLWPKVRIVYYIFSVGFLLLALIGIAVITLRRSG